MRVSITHHQWGVQATIVVQAIASRARRTRTCGHDLVGTLAELALGLRHDVPESIEVRQPADAAKLQS